MNSITQAQTKFRFQPIQWVSKQLRQLESMAQVLGTIPPFLALLAGSESLTVVEIMDYALLKTPSFQKAVTYLQQDPACAALIAERYMAPAHDLDALLQYPQDSLGYCYAVQMKAKGFRAEDLYEGFSITSDATYLEARLSQTHDIWHTITGFSASPIDEIGLQAFHLPQLPYPLGVALIASSMMSTMLFAPDELPALLDAIGQGWQMGRLAKPLFAQKWEEAWEKPLSQWREELNLQPIPAA